MKTLGLCSLLLLVLVSSAWAQDLLSAPTQNPLKAPILNPDKDALRKWLAHGGPAEWAKLTGGRLIIRHTDSEASCAYVRTYRVEREQRGSDAVRSADYTVCVPMRRFEMKSAVLRPSDQ